MESVFSADVLKQAIDEAKTSKEPIHLILQADNYVVNADIDYHDGERYPSLQRVDGTTDYLDDITTPLVKTDDTKPLFTHHEDREPADSSRAQWVAILDAHHASRTWKTSNPNVILRDAQRSRRVCFFSATAAELIH